MFTMFQKYSNTSGGMTRPASLNPQALSLLAHSAAFSSSAPFTASSTLATLSLPSPASRFMYSSSLKSDCMRGKLVLLWSMPNVLGEIELSQTSEPTFLINVGVKFGHLLVIIIISSVDARLITRSYIGPHATFWSSVRSYRATSFWA